METPGSIVFIVVGLSGVVGQGLNWGAPSSDFIPAAVTLTPQYFCRYFVWGWRVRYANYPDGTVCWYSRRQGILGRCFKGKCFRETAPIPGPCDRMYKGPGYAISCNYTCSANGAITNYNDGTPCLTLRANGRPFGGAGFCSKGACTPSYDLTNQEEKQVHPKSLIQCPLKEHTGRNVLQSCYHYCLSDGHWFAGYYDSNMSSTCYLPARTGNQDLGWCCEGNCITTYYCGRQL
ncbi:hypothetical protein MRX96_042303 [Rhipicephalus microplus]